MMEKLKEGAGGQVGFRCDFQAVEDKDAEHGQKH